MAERIGYKVVTAQMESLGLRKNPNRLTFPVKKWVKLPKSQIESGKGDWGGIWVAASLGGARKLRKYMEEEKNIVGCRIFLTRIKKVLYENSYRIKTNAVFLEEEITGQP